jgi:hypothetical protein
MAWQIGRTTGFIQIAVPLISFVRKSKVSPFSTIKTNAMEEEKASCN